MRDPDGRAALILPDVNVLVYAHRGGTPESERMGEWLETALAIESGSEWVTTDRGFARFEGLRWRHPLA